MTNEQLAALVADNRNAAAAIGKRPHGVIAKIIIKRHTNSADAIEHLQAEVARLSRAHAAETAKREAMEDALRELTKACEGEVVEVFDGEIGIEYVHARATLAKHGSKT